LYKKFKLVALKKTSFVVIFMITEYLLKNSLLYKRLMTMNVKLKKLAVILITMVVLLSYILINMEVVYSNNTHGEFDLFTQKDPYNGEGANMPSDAFAPEEEVQIFALVTYNECPVQNILVAFEISGPRNPVENITFYRGVFTNETGVATISFRTPSLNETTFGEWTVTGNTKIADLTFQDMITFKVGWIVEIVSVKTINENHIDQEKFVRESYVGIKLALRNIAMTEKTATLTVTIYDCLNTPINSTKSNDFVLQPNGTLVYAYFFLYIPKSASIGRATVYACAFTITAGSNYVPYCPEVSKHFLIINRDVVVLNVRPFPLIVYEGDIVYINVTIVNKGSEFESFNVSVYCNWTFIDVIAVFDLQPYSNVTIRFNWNTSGMLEGVYLISAFAAPVPGEIDIFDNSFIDDFVEIKAKPIHPPPTIHDIAVLSATPSSNTVYIGEILEINVTVKNEGNSVESFNVLVYYDSNVVGAIFVDSLMPNCTETLVFHWDTNGVTSGNYTLSAQAEHVTDEEDTDDNSLEDGVVEVKHAPARWFVPCWFWWLLLLLLIIVLILLLIWLYRRRKQKKDEETFYSGWTAWYYCYDLRNRTSKT